MRQRFIAAAGTFGGTAPLASNATIALTIAKAEAQHAELLKRITEAEATIAKLMEASTTPGRNQPPPLTVQEAEQIHNIFISIKEQPALPIPRPPAEVSEAPKKLNSIRDNLKRYADNFLTEASKSSGKAAGRAISFVAICYYLIDHLTALSNHISDWLSTIGTLLN